MRVFLICPVRGITVEEKAKIKEYILSLEADGHLIHWPLRDTPQDGDQIGLRICTDNFNAAAQADEIHVWWNGNSQGSYFDLGIAFALKKKIVLANKIERTPEKSFINVLLELDGRIRA